MQKGDMGFQRQIWGGGGKEAKIRKGRKVKNRIRFHFRREKEGRCETRGGREDNIQT